MEGDISCGGLEKEMKLVVRELWRSSSCTNVVEVRRVCDGAMTLVVVFDEDVLRWMCGHAPQSGRSL